MAATQRLFIYKCIKGHVTQKLFPLGTRFDTSDEITCVQCFDSGEFQKAYLVYAEAITTGAK